jgi:uncharacterized membrane protein YkvA (DUF1232 family)
MRIELRNARAWFGDPAVSTWSKALGLFALAYAFSPIDAVPDFLPVIGWLDDFGVVTAVAGFYLRRIGAYRPSPSGGPEAASSSADARPRPA